MCLEHCQCAQIVFRLTPFEAFLSVIITDIFISESHTPSIQHNQMLDCFRGEIVANNIVFPSQEVENEGCAIYYFKSIFKTFIKFKIDYNLKTIL